MGKYKTLLINLGLFTLNTVATRLITFFLVPLYTYFLSQEEYGITDMAQTLQMVLIPIATLSLSDALLRFAIDDQKHNRKYFTLGTYGVALSCVVVFALLPGLDLPIFGGLGDYKLLYWLIYCFGALQTLFSCMARALNQLKLITMASILTSLITCGSAAILIALLHWKVEGFLLSMILGYAIGCATYVFGGHLYRYIGTHLGKSDLALLRRMLIYALPLIPNALFWWVGTSINRFFITGMLGIGASGLFAAASKIPNLLNTFYSIFQQAWTLSAFQEFRKTDIRSFFSTVFVLLQSLMAVVASLFILGSQWVASFMLQKDFYQGWELMPIIILAFYFNALNSFFGTVFTSSMKTRALMTSTVAGGLVCIALTWALIPLCGLWGACIASVFCNAVVLVIRIMESRAIINVRIPWPSFLITLILLLIQTIVMSAHKGAYLWISFVLCLAVLVTQIIGCVPLMRKVALSLRR